MKVSKVSLTKEKFLIALDKGKKGYAQKPKSWQKIWYWWEDHSDAWFMNVYKEEKKGSLLLKKEEVITRRGARSSSSSSLSREKAVEYIEIDLLNSLSLFFIRLSFSSFFFFFFS